jgi:hypothetical protein
MTLLFIGVLEEFSGHRFGIQTRCHEVVALVAQHTHQLDPILPVVTITTTRILLRLKTVLKRPLNLSANSILQMR